jgi:hypothetical protein
MVSPAVVCGLKRKSIPEEIDSFLIALVSSAVMSISSIFREVDILNLPLIIHPPVGVDGEWHEAPILIAKATISVFYHLDKI